jgi:TolA-binding protein
MTMPKEHPGKVSRWVDHAAGAELDAHLGDVFRTLQDEQPLSAGDLAAVGRRLSRGGQRPGARRGMRHLLLVFAVLMGGGSVALAEWKRPGFWHLQAYFSPRTLENAGSARTASAARAVGDGPRGATSKPNAATALPTPPSEANAEVAAAPPTDTPRPPPVSNATKAPASVAARPSALGLESEALQKALVKLRRDHDGSAALSLLDEYQARFPHGELSLEASVARVDALLLQGRRREALELLARLPLDRVGRRSELRLVRAELYAERDCRQALADFDAVLASGSSERALYGRAGCRLRSGDSAGGQADLRSYLERFPSGRFASQVRARLAAP